jgi:hypothetical protein
MTFILNVLHKDFSILAADTQAGASGDVTIGMEGMTIHVNSPKVTINGFNKLFPNKSRTLVAGMAGVTNAHTYVSELEHSVNAAESLALVHDHVTRVYLESDRIPIYRGEPTHENQALLCYYDGIAGKFTTNVLKFHPVYMQSSLFHSTAVGLLHIGTGSVAMEAAIDQDRRKEFADSIIQETDPKVCLDWISHAFKMVSEKAEGCGQEFTAYAATRQSPIFEKIHG